MNLDKNTPLYTIIYSNVNKINAYLSDGSDGVVLKRRDNLCGFPDMVRKHLRDGNHLSLTQEDRDELLRQSPEAKRFIKNYSGSREYINGIKRYCLWIDDKYHLEAEKVPFIKQRVDEVRKFRLSEKNAATRAMASKPWSFFRKSYKPTNAIIVQLFLLSRQYIPLGFVDENMLYRMPHFCSI